MIKEIHSTGLSVRDLEASISFYCTEEAYEVIERFDIADDDKTRAAYGIDNSEAKGALLRGHAGFLELTQFSDNHEPEGDARGVYAAGLRHICIRARDGHGLFDNLVEKGAGWHARPSGLGTGVDYAYIRDPEGNLIELEGLPMMPPGVMKPWFDHAALVSADMDRLAGFYEMLTETKMTRRNSFGPEAKFDKVAGLEGIVFDGSWILFGLSRIEMWEYKIPETKPTKPHAANEIGWSHLCLEVDDLDIEYDRLSKESVEFLGDIRTTEWGRSIFLRDVDGNLVRLLEPSEERPELSVANLPARPILKQIREASERPRKGQN